MSTPVKPSSLLDLTFAGLEKALDTSGVRPVHAAALWRAMHRDVSVPLCDREDLSPPLRRWVASQVTPGGSFHCDAPEVATDAISTDGFTRKYLLRLADGETVETVLMGYPGRHTVCISTQAGCAMGCVFCATGQMGFLRHLRPGEMVSQVLQARRDLRSRGEEGPRNIVLMGMGEPLHNYSAVMTALEIISDTRGLNIGPGRITISTVGVVPAILRMAEERRPYLLAVSLHAANQAEREAIVPVSRRWPLAELMEACRVYGAATGRRIFFEWTLIAGKNDSPQHARALVELIGRIDAHVNLIPLNPTQGFAEAPSTQDSAAGFQATLREGGIPSTVRQRRGIDVAAGCGQLRSGEVTAKAGAGPGSPAH